MRTFYVVCLGIFLSVSGSVYCVCSSSSQTEEFDSKDPFISEQEAERVLSEEQQKEEILDGLLTQTGSRLHLRELTCRNLLHNEIDIPTAFKIFDYLNRCAKDPTHPEAAWKSDFERHSWIAEQIRTNLRFGVGPLEPEGASERIQVILNRISWMLAEMQCN